MSHLSIHALMTARPQAVAAPTAAADDKGFEALLGRMSDKAPAAERAEKAGARETSARDESHAPPEASTLTALQSLEAALANIAQARPAAAPAPVAARPESAATPLGAALNQAVGALGDSAAAPGSVSIKGMLQADPALGLKDVQMRTFLAVAGATPARSGGATLSPDTAWSLPTATPAPLAAAKIPTSAPAATTAATSVPLATALKPPAPVVSPLGPVPLAAAPVVKAATINPVAINPVVASPLAASPLSESPVAANPVAEIVPSVSPVAPVPAASPLAAPVRKPGAEGRADAPVSTHAVSATSAASPTANAALSTEAQNSEGGGADAEASQASPSVFALDAASPDASAPTNVSVSLANLPAFIAGEASSLTDAAATDAPAGSSSPATPAAVRTAQAVKELRISLDPSNLGEMTVKLRLANGRLSVSIEVANATTLGSIQDDRDLIAARLAGGGQSLEDLTISRQSLSTPEASQANGSDDSGSRDEGGGSDPDAKHRPPARSGAGAGGFGDLLV